MRKILTYKEREEKDIKNKRIIGLVLGAILLFSTVGYMIMDFLGNKPETRNYKGIEFLNNNGFWIFKIEGYSFQTQYLPTDTENISVQVVKNIGDYADKIVYYAVDEEFSVQNEALTEILTNLNQFGTRTNPACMNENCTNPDAPIKTCDSNVIIFQESQTNSSSIKQENNCVYFYYTSGQSLLSADAFLFKILDIQ